VNDKMTNTVHVPYFANPIAVMKLTISELRLVLT